MRRRVPVYLVALGVAMLLGWYVVYTQTIVRELRREAERQGRIFALEKPVSPAARSFT